MANEANSLSVVAIVVALVALVTTLGQVLQQYFATADGYRRCQSSVIGPWAKRTRLRWRWSEFRFETLFTTPHIQLYRHNWQSPATPAPPLKGRQWIVESYGPEAKLDSLISGGEDDVSDHVTWLRFLRATQWAHKKMLSRLKAGTYAQDEKTKSEVLERESQYLTIPLITFEERSWDFMPPDVVKPYARTSVGDIAIIARRLGMEWERFEPADGILRAQGNGYMLTSTSVRSVGTMIQISEMLGVGKQGPWMPFVSPIIPDVEMNGQILLIPSAAADKMAFGILPAVGSDFLHRDFRFNTVADIKETLDWFTRDPATSRSFDGGFMTSFGWHPGVSDLLGIAAPLLYRPDLGLVGVPSPTTLPVLRGPTAQAKGFLEFTTQLTTLISTVNPSESSPLHWVLATHSALTAMHPEYTDGIDPIDREYALLSAIHAAHLQTTSFLSPPNQPGGKSPFFRYLASSHLQHITKLFRPAYNELARGPEALSDKVRNSRVRTSVNYYDRASSEEEMQEMQAAAAASAVSEDPMRHGMATYFACLSPMLDIMETEIAAGGVPGLRIPEGCWSREQLMGGWVVLVFRAMLWNRCHYLVKGGTVPMVYCGSQLPVYIG